MSRSECNSEQQKWPSQVPPALISSTGQLIFGLVSVLGAELFLTTENLGVWYSLLALSGGARFFDLGFMNLVVIFFSARDNKDKLEYFSAIDRAKKYHLLLLSVFSPVVLIIGFVIFFTSGTEIIVQWICFFISIVFQSCTLLNFSIIEGNHKVLLSHLLKGSLHLTNALGVFFLLIFGFEVLALIVSTVLVNTTYYIITCRIISLPTFRFVALNVKNFKNCVADFFPLHKLTIISSISGIIATHSFIPMLFLLDSPSTAAMYGFVWNAFLIIGNLSNSFSLSLISPISKAISDTQNAKHEILFPFKIVGKSLILFLMLVISFFGFTFCFPELFAYTGIGFISFAFLIASLAVNIITNFFIVFIRALRIEPFVKISTLSGIWLLGAQYIAIQSQNGQLYFLPMLVSSIVSFIFIRRIYRTLFRDD